MTHPFRKLFFLLLALALLLSGCVTAGPSAPAPSTAPPGEGLVPFTGTPAPAPTETPAPETPASTETSAATEAPAPALAEDGSYTAPEDVALYLHTYGRLPENYITKAEARDLGWDSGKGNLWDVAPGKSIGGDRFGNYEGLLPKGSYRECDVNYAGGYRGGERLIYDDQGGVWYTADHYQSFTRLYGEEGRT